MGGLHYRVRPCECPDEDGPPESTIISVATGEPVFLQGDCGVVIGEYLIDVCTGCEHDIEGEIMYPFLKYAVYYNQFSDTISQCDDFVRPSRNTAQSLLMRVMNLKQITQT